MACDQIRRNNGRFFFILNLSLAVFFILNLALMAVASDLHLTIQSGTKSQPELAKKLKISDVFNPTRKKRNNG